MTPLVRVAAVGAIAWLSDAASKSWAANHDTARIIAAIPKFFFVLVPPVVNPGGAMGIHGALARPLAIAVAVAMSLAAAFWMVKISRQAPGLSLGEQIGFGLFLGGTLGNLGDRLTRDGVLDFLNLAPVPLMFNVADAAVTLAVFLIVVETFRLRRFSKG
jgi:signal peptidase II